MASFLNATYVWLLVDPAQAGSSRTGLPESDGLPAGLVAWPLRLDSEVTVARPTSKGWYCAVHCTWLESDSGLPASSPGF